MNNNFPLKNIKMVISDFDGIFTDGKLCVYSDGKTSKQIDYKDIMAISILIKKGIKFAIISGEYSKAIDIFKEKFPVIETFQNERKKLQVLKNLSEKYNISPLEMVYLGDDINDEECLKFVAYPFTVPNAHQSIKDIENIHVTTAHGGSGAFREVADIVE